MELTGLSKMPDEEGVVQTYAFVVKTSEARAPEVSTNGKGTEPKPKRNDKTLQETHVLQAFPEILDESTTPTEEQAEKSLHHADKRAALVCRGCQHQQQDVRSILARRELPCQGGVLAAVRSGRLHVKGSARSEDQGR